jgi:hypothetical protein
MDLEIGVARQIVGEEAKAGFEGDRLSGGGEKLLLFSGQ